MSNLYLWQGFEKRKNSTKQPLDGSKITKTGVYLKEGTSLEQPVFVLSSNDFTYNYAQYNGTYYFIDDIVSVKNNLIELHCSKDVLATYKAKIKAASAYVLYYTHSNTEISDKRLSAKTTKSVVKETGVFDTLGNGTGTNYAVALNVIGEGACDTYVTDQATARGILDNLDNWFDNTGSYTSTGSGIKDTNDSIFSWASVEDSIKSFLQETLFFWKQWFSTGKAADNLKSAFMLPLPTSAISGVSDTIKLGQYDTGKSATRVNDRIFSDGCTVTIPWQGIADWRRNSPYMELYLYIPYVGLISLSPSDLIGDTSLNVSVSIDITCGDAVFSVYTDTNRYIGQYCTNLAATFAVGTSNVQPAQLGNTLIGASVAGAAAIATGGSAAIMGAFSGGALSLANNISGNPTCIGANMGGAVLGLTDKVVCYSVFHDVSVGIHAQSAIAGEPYNGVMSLSGVSGYVQTSGASVEVGGFGNDKDIINSYLNGGIYIE